MQLAGHAAILERPRGARALLVLAHGAGAGMRHPFMAELAAALAARAIATVRWEFRYITEGKRRPPRAEDAEVEVRAVWNAAAKLTKLPRFAGGKSFGGRMTSRAHAAAPLPGARGLVFAGFPLHPAGKPAPRVIDASSRGFPASLPRAEHLARAPGPMLFVQGTRDELAELALLRPVVAALGTRATLHVIEGADHGFTRTGNVDAAAAAIADWIALHL